ncbi:MAG: NAD(+) synthase [Clostridia bacterium]|nr:NAD(+) synthase [Clostridia bacterium]
MRDYAMETQQRVDFIRKTLDSAGAGGLVFGNSGGKDSALVGILCKMACPDTVGLIMPCGSKRNFREDRDDAETVARQFGIASRVIDLTPARDALVAQMGGFDGLSRSALSNIAPRLRMTTLYAVAARENRLVAGTGNRSEAYMGYFTKWGDGACDFNPIGDLTVTEIYAFLRYLQAPPGLISKAPSAGLFDGQTDEDEMGITYQRLDAYLLQGVADPAAQEVIEPAHRRSCHKRQAPRVYGG